MKLSQVVARVALAGCFLVVGTVTATAEESASEPSAQAASDEAVSLSGGPAATADTAPVAAPVEADATVAQAVTPAAKAKSPWGGSSIGYGFGFSAVSLDKASGQTWNPYVTHSLAFEPRWRFHEYLGVRLRIDVEQELTNSDETIKQFEWTWSDLNIDVNVGKGYTEPVTGINVNGSLRFGLPVSKASQARTMVLSLSPGLSISRKFPVLAGLTVAYSGRFAYQFHQSTTAQYDGTGLSCGDPDSDECAPFLNTGLRNVQTVLAHGPAISLDILDNLSLTVSYTLRRSGLYGNDDYEIRDSGSGIYLGTLEPGANDITARYSQLFALELAWAPIDMVKLALDVSSSYADLRPDGTYQTPFFNRFTMVNLGIGLDIDSVIQALNK
ncbi:MAG: hypothetical protein LBM75_07345 [Myxococcales bacterium]|jgi:hypothetical protein|nr:hypothetical protein [Myxococcales bacterium]